MDLRDVAAGKLHEGGIALIGGIRKLPSEYIRANIVITTMGVDSYPPLLCSMRMPGSDRIMFSIDYPWESTKEAPEFVDNTPLSDIDREKICHLNSERVLNMA